MDSTQEKEKKIFPLKHIVIHAKAKLMSTKQNLLNKSI